MIDTMTGTKIVGGFCGTFLVFLLGGWVAELVYVSEEAGHDEEHVQAYVIPVEESGAEEAPEEEVNVEEVLAAASASDGESLYRNCRSCHAIEEGVNGAGPSLYGVVGREVASVDGFSYSGALVEAADVWTPENLFHFLEDPSGYAPGTAMSYAGMRDPADRANLIAYLDGLDG